MAVINQDAVLSGGGSGESGGGDGGGNTSFSITDLDLLAVAQKTPSTMQLTPDLDNFIQGTNSVGEVKTAEPPPSELFYDAYTLSNAQNMLLQANNMFVPDIANNPMAAFGGDIAALGASQYLINLGNQQHTFIHFKNSQTNEILELHIDNAYQRVKIAGQVAAYVTEPVNSLVIQITEQNSVRVLKWNSSLDVRPNISSLPLGFDKVSFLVSQNDGSTPIEHTTSQFVQLARGNYLVTLKPISAYFKATTGQFKLSLDSAKAGALYIFNIDSQPTDKLTYSEVAGNYLNNIAIGVQSIGNGNIFLLVGRMVGETALSIQIADATGIENFIFKFVNNTSFEIYRDEAKIGEIDFFQNILPYFQTVCEFPAAEIDSFGFDLSQSYESLNYRLPNSAADGDTYHLLTGGTLFNKQLLTGDYITVYANKTNIAINRLPKLPIKKRLPIIRYANYISVENLYAIYDEQLGTITIEGEYYHSDDGTVGGMFAVDISSISQQIRVKSNLVGIVASSTYTFDVELVDGRININTSSGTYGQHLFLGLVVGVV